MNRIDQIFARLRQQSAKALMPFIVAGDPDLQTTAELLPAMQDAGAAICELGIAFSDPIADGPVIQASMTHALSQNVRPQQTLDMVSQLRKKLDMGVVTMVSYSIVHRIGHSFLEHAQAAGVDGLIIPDLPVEESADLRKRAADHGLTCSFLIAPTTPLQRAEKIARACTGFVYVLSRSGLTGERTQLPADLPLRLERLRQVTDLPLAVGFGISSAEQVRDVVRVADAAIVGSAIMRRIAPSRSLARAAIVQDVKLFVSDLASGLKHA